MDGRATSKFAALSLCLGLALAVIPVTAGNGSWSVTGSPSGGGAYKVIVDPSTPSILYSTSGPGVFKSTDSGATWTLIFATLNGPADLQMDPQAPGTLYVAYDGDSAKTLFKTTDGGATWSEADTGIGTIEDGASIDGIHAIAVDPVDEGVVYAASNNTGMYRTVDGGAHWHSINSGLSGIIFLDSFVTQVTVDPVTPNVVYLVDVVMTSPGSTVDTSVMGIYKSTDSGAHWSATGLTGSYVANLQIDPADHTHLFTCTLGVITTSPDSGASWSSGGSCPSGATQYAVDPSDNQHLLVNTTSAGFYESTDGGASYTAISSIPGSGENFIAFDPVTPGTVYVASGVWGMFKSTDSGATWTQSTTGIHNVVVDLMLEGADGITYLASAGSGIFTSPDQGVTWSQVGSASGGPTGSLPAMGDFVYSLVEDPTATSTLYAGTTGGIFMTTDGGAHWTETDSGVPDHGYTLALAIDPEATSTLYAATNTDGAGVYKSTDGGATWNPAGNGLTMDVNYGGFQALAVDPHDSDVVYAGAFHTGLFKSTDGGASWQPDNGAIGVSDIWSVAVDPDDSDIVYTATSNGFFKSTDAGATWTESDWGLGGNFLMTDIQFDPSDSSILYATQRYGIGDAFVSPDAGYTWYDMSTLAPVGVDSAAGKSVGHPLLSETRALPGGRSRPAGLGQVSIRAAAIGPNTTTMLGGASDGQVYRFDVKNLPKGGHPQSSGGGTGGSGGSGGTSGGSSGASGGSAGGGGSFSLLALLGLAGAAARRRR